MGGATTDIIHNCLVDSSIGHSTDVHSSLSFLQVVDKATVIIKSNFTPLTTYIMYICNISYTAKHLKGNLFVVFYSTLNVL